MTDARASRVAVEALTALTPTRKVSRINAELLLDPKPPRRVSTLRVEVLHSTAAAVPPTTGTLAATLPRLGAALTGTVAAARTGTLAATLPRLGAALTGTAAADSQPPPARTGTLAATLPTVAGHLASQLTQPPALLPALAADLHGAVPIVHRTDTTWRNDGHRYVSTAHVDYAPAVVDPPPHLHRQDVRRVHQSLPTPTIVKGRPQ